jgi:hypothetical protein
MSDIKAGDLVMIVRGMPCCGGSGGWSFGEPFTVTELETVFDCGCAECGAPFPEAVVAHEEGGNEAFVYCLQKIDPSAEGDTLPTRANLDQPVNPIRSQL